jgi:polyisoprenyl-phosphate glycosyltransferase
VVVSTAACHGGLVSARQSSRSGLRRAWAGTPSYGFRQLASLFSRAFFDFSNVPLRGALVLGSVAIVLCAVYLLFVLVALIVGKAIPPGYVSLIFVFAFLSSVNLTMIGVLGLYISRIHDEVRARPTYVIARNRMRGN